MAEDEEPIPVERGPPEHALDAVGLVEVNINRTGLDLHPVPLSRRPDNPQTVGGAVGIGVIQFGTRRTSVRDRNGPLGEVAARE